MANGLSGPDIVGAMARHLERFPTADALMAAAAESFVSDATEAVRASGRFAVALAGGSTPRRLYELLEDPDRARANAATEAMMRMRKIVVSELEAAADAV